MYPIQYSMNFIDQQIIVVVLKSKEMAKREIVFMFFIGYILYPLPTILFTENQNKKFVFKII